MGSKVKHESFGTATPEEIKEMVAGPYGTKDRVVGGVS